MKIADMKLSLVLATPRSAAFEVANAFPFASPHPHRAYLDGRLVYQGGKNVFTLHGLRPASSYSLAVASGGETQSVRFETAHESFALDVRACGAVGDGVTDDTAALQAGLSSCPAGGTVIIPEGTWLSAPLFLKSDTDVYLARGARLVGHQDIERWPIVPGVVRDHAGRSEIFLGSWEGQPADCHAGLITGIQLSNVRIHGEGCIDGNATFDTWWSRPRQPFRGWRPRTIFLVGCDAVSVGGLTLRNSPSWTIHPLRCRRVRCVDLAIEQPHDSPNTDGITPESCEDVLVAGVRFSTGDDCIALKSGKAWIAERAARPTRGVVIANCRMERGHGAVVIGSEMAGGIYDVLARDCVFDGTDRGLRIKTRRGRGPHAVVDGVRLRNVRMHNVGTPFVVNSFYNCDPDGHSPEVADREPRPVDTSTPTLRNVQVSDVHCEGVAHSAGFVLGLPERPIENLSIDNYRVRFDPNATEGIPDMADSIPPALCEGMFLCNVRGVLLDGIDIEGARGPALRQENVE